jgi:predicted outer membrane repeat protein
VQEEEVQEGEEEVQEEGAQTGEGLWMSMKRHIAGIAVGVGIAFAMPSAALAESISVDSLADPSDPGKTTLRDAIVQANASAGVPTYISFATGITGTVELANPLPVISDEVNLSKATGGPASLVTISGGDTHRIFDTLAPLHLNGLTLADGSATGAGGAIRVSGGTRISAYACEFVSNSATTTGGAISVGPGEPISGIDSSTFTGNWAGTDGGAIYGEADSTVRIGNSTLTANDAGGSGGAAAVQGGPSAPQSSFFQVNSSTIAGNTAVTAGGGFTQIGTHADAQLRSTIVRGNTPAGGSPELNVDFSLVEAPTAGTQNIVGDPMLGPLQLNGGATRTMLPAPTGAGIDKGSFGGSAPPDQRDFTRLVDIPWVTNATPFDPTDAGTDIGAVELTLAEGPPAPPTPPPPPRPTPTFDLRAALKKCKRIKNKKKRKKCQKKARKRAAAAR